jgi:hypothetical protein
LITECEANNMAASMPPSDRTVLVETRLAGVEHSVNALLTAMNLVIDTLQQQTHLLAELADAAKEAPEPSPVVGAIETLTSAVVTMGEGIDALRFEMSELPEHLKAALTGDAAAGPASNPSRPSGP